VTRSAWDDLTRELAAWADSGRTARWWWRDDDAIADTPMLKTLLDLADGKPIAIAAVPRFSEPSLAKAIEARDGVSILLHGWAHANHEPADRKRAEFGAARDLGAATGEIERGMAALRALAPDRFRPIFVPPWNRISPDLSGRLGQVGLALSTFNDRPPGSGASRVNTHVDVLDWGAKKRDGRAAFIGEGAALATLTDALRRRRLAEPETDPMEPVGLLTHHLEHDAATWRFLETLLPRLDAHPAARRIDAEEGLDR
jgi:hypothetical protein